MSGADRTTSLAMGPVSAGPVFSEAENFLELAGLKIATTRRLRHDDVAEQRRLQLEQIAQIRAYVEAADEALRS